MAVTNNTPRKVAPAHPGEMLREDFLPDFDLTTSGLADALNVSRQTVNEILRERRAISSTMALKLGRLFGNSPAFWLGAQQAHDLWQAEREHRKEIVKIRPLSAA